MESISLVPCRPLQVLEGAVSFPHTLLVSRLNSPNVLSLSTPCAPVWHSELHNLYLILFNPNTLPRLAVPAGRLCQQGLPKTPEIGAISSLTQQHGTRPALQEPLDFSSPDTIKFLLCFTVQGVCVKSILKAF